MAQTANVNIKIDSTQAEGSINKFNNSLKETNAQAGTLKSQLRAMQNELNGLEPGSQRFNELALAAGKLKDQIQDTQAVIKATAGSSVENLAKGLATAGQVGIAAFQGMASAQALFGVESEALTQTLVKLQALAGLSQALETLGGLGDKFTEIKASMLGFVKGLGLVTAAKETDIVVTGAEIVATEGATFATKAWGVAMKALPIVAIIAGISALVYAISSYNSSNEEAEKAEKKRIAALKISTAASKEHAESVGKESSKFVGLIYQLKVSNKNSVERSNLIKKVNSQYGTTLKNMSDETSFQATLNLAVAEYIALKEAEYRTKKNEAVFEKVMVKKIQLTDDLMKYERERKDLLGKTTIATREQLDAFANSAKVQNDYKTYGIFISQMRAKIGEIEREDEKLKSLTIRHEDLKERINDLTEGGKKYVEQQDKTNTSTDETITINEDLKKSLEELVKLQNDRTASTEYLLRAQKEGKDAELKLQYQLSTDLINRDQQLKDALLLNEKDYQAKLLKYKEGTDIVEAETRINTLRLKMAKATGIELIALEIQLQNEQLKLLEEQYQSELLAAGNNYKEQEKITSQYLLDKQKMEDEFADKSVEKTKETADKTGEVWSSGFSKFMDVNAEMINFATSSISEAMGLLDEIFQLSADKATASREMFYNQEVERLDKQLTSQLISREEYDNQVELLNQQKDQKELAAKRKAFKQQKAMAIIGAIISTAGAVASALTMPPPAGYIMAAVSAALGAVQIGIISSQQFKAAKGGVVPGSQSGMDSVNALLSPGETVINSQSSSMFPELLSMVNQAGGGHSLTPQTPGKMKTSGVTVFQDNTSQPSVRAYVVESEITDKQRRVNRIERAVQF